MTKKAIEDEELLVPWTESGIPWECKADSSRARYYDFISRKHVDDEVVWKKNEPFDAAFKIVEMIPGSESCKIALKETQNEKIYYIRDYDFVKAINETSTIYGIILGKWKATRTVGRYFGIKLVGTLTQKPPKKDG